MYIYITYFSELCKEYMWNDKQKIPDKEKLAKIKHIVILFTAVVHFTIFAHKHPFASLTESRCLERKC